MQSPSPQRHDPYLALRHPDYRNYLTGSFCSNMGRQMTTVAVAWQIYQWTHSAAALGLVGFLNVLPLLFLSLPAGMVADRLDRRRVIALTCSGMAVLSLLLALVSYFHDRIPSYPLLLQCNELLSRLTGLIEKHEGLQPMHFDHPALPLMYLILFLMAVLRILGWPSRTAIIPLLLPPNALNNAVTWNSSAFEISTMAGPAIGGFILAWAGFPVVYVLDALFGLYFAAAVLGANTSTVPHETRDRSLKGMLAGVEFIWNRKIILAASSLDLFAVLLGGAVALLPIYADQILHVGPIGLGWLRAAPSVGAFSMAMWLAHRRPLQQPGVTLLWSVAGFGLAIMVFGLSSWFWLSLLALFFTGVFDNVSVVVRQTLVQLLTPDHLRGRVTAVNQIFIGSSNEIGTLRAGLMAALAGPVLAVVAGGLGTVAVTLLVARFLPQLLKTPPLDALKTESEMQNREIAKN